MIRVFLVGIGLVGSAVAADLPMPPPLPLIKPAATYPGPSFHPSAPPLVLPLGTGRWQRGCLDGGYFKTWTNSAGEKFWASVTNTHAEPGQAVAVPWNQLNYWLDPFGEQMFAEQQLLPPPVLVTNRYGAKYPTNIYQR